LFGLRARKAATISGKAEIRLSTFWIVRSSFPHAEKRDNESRPTSPRTSGLYQSESFSQPPRECPASTLPVAIQGGLSRVVAVTSIPHTVLELSQKNARYKEILAQDSPN